MSKLNIDTRFMGAGHNTTPIIYNRSNRIAQPPLSHLAGPLSNKPSLNQGAILNLPEAKSNPMPQVTAEIDIAGRNNTISVIQIKQSTQTQVNKVVTQQKNEGERAIANKTKEASRQINSIVTEQGKKTIKQAGEKQRETIDSRIKEQSNLTPKGYQTSETSINIESALSEKGGIVNITA